MKKFVLSGIFLSSLLSVSSAEACTYVIDQDAKSAELKQVALASLGSVTLLEASVVDFTYHESKPTPMCPKELTYQATINVAYENGLNTCDVALAVVKVEPWADSDTDTYRVSGRRTARCRKN